MHHSPLPPLSGAVLAPRPESPDRSAPAHFGDPRSEYEAALHGAALWDTTERGALLATGTEAGAFLHRITAAPLRDLEAEREVRCLLLSPKGRVLFDVDVGLEASGLVLSTPPGGAAACAEALEAYRFAEDVHFEDLTERHAPLELCGPRAPDVLGRVLTAPPREGGRTRAHRLSALGPAVVSACEVAGRPGWRVDVGAERAKELWAALVEAGATPAGLEAREALRLEAGRPLFGLELGEELYPQEAGLAPGDGFHLDKGCYVGQEVVAKIDTYGGLNRRLVGLRLAQGTPPARGVEVLTEDGDPVGTITSSARSFALEAPLALALVRSRAFTRAAGLRVEGHEARVVELPLPAAGPVGGPQSSPSGAEGTNASGVPE